MFAVTIALALHPAVPASALPTTSTPTEITVELTQPITTPADTAVYDEDFTTYAAKEYTDATEWDIWSHNLPLSRRDGISQQAWTQYAAARTARGTHGAGLMLVVATMTFTPRSWTRTAIGSGLMTCGSTLGTMRLSSGILPLQWIPAETQSSFGKMTRDADQSLCAEAGSKWQQALGNRRPGQLTAASVGTTFCTAVAVDKAGNAIVVWDGVYAQKLDPNGNRQWRTDVQVTVWGQTATVALDNVGETLLSHLLLRTALAAEAQWQRRQSVGS